MFAKPLLDNFPLCSKYDPLPFDRAVPLIVLAHHIRALVEHMNQGVARPLEMVGGKSGLMFLHTPLA